MREMSEMDLRERLKRVGEGHRDALRADSRQRILRAAAEASRGSARSALTGLWPQAVAVGAILGLLALPAFMIDRADPGPDSRPPVTDLEVTTVEGQVVLTWSNGDQPRRVVRATSRQDLAHPSRLPGEVVRGHRWVDSSPDGPDLVYYIVE